MDAFAALAPYLFAVLFVASIVWTYVRNRKRRDALVQLCAARGWGYAADDPTLCWRWSGQPFGQGDNPKAVNVVTGTASGHPFTAFDYSYETHTSNPRGGRTTTTHQFAVCAVPMPAPLGSVEVVPENPLTRAAGAVGLMRDIKLESEEFNRRFRVAATNPKLASDLLTPRTMEFLLSAPALAWRTEGADVLSWHAGHIDGEWIVTAVGVVDRVLDGIPAFVWKDRGYDPRS
jgi:hypothetical protein